MVDKHFIVAAIAVGVAGLFYEADIKRACKAAGFSPPACDDIDSREVARLSLISTASGSPAEPGFNMTDPVAHVQREVIVQPARWWYIERGPKTEPENEGKA